MNDITLKIIIFFIGKIIHSMLTTVLKEIASQHPELQLNDQNFQDALENKLERKLTEGLAEELDPVEEQGDSQIILEC